MSSEELGDCAIDATTVVRTDETMAGIVEGDVADLLLSLAQRRDVLLAFTDRYAWIARTVSDQHRHTNAIHPMDR